jgi:hypothetical protein
VEPVTLDVSGGGSRPAGHSIGLPGGRGLRGQEDDSRQEALKARSFSDVELPHQHADSSRDQLANSKWSSAHLNQHFDDAEVMPGFGRVIEAELTRRMKVFKKWFENHRHILALSFVSHKFSAKNLIEEIVADKQCFSTVEPRRITWMKL